MDPYLRLYGQKLELDRGKRVSRTAMELRNQRGDLFKRLEP